MRPVSPIASAGKQPRVKARINDRLDLAIDARAAQGVEVERTAHQPRPDLDQHGAVVGPHHLGVRGAPSNPDSVQHPLHVGDQFAGGRVVQGHQI